MLLQKRHRVPSKCNVLFLVSTLSSCAGQNNIWSNFPLTKHAVHCPCCWCESQPRLQVVKSVNTIVIWPVSGWWKLIEVHTWFASESWLIIFIQTTGRSVGLSCNQQHVVSLQYMWMCLLVKSRVFLGVLVAYNYIISRRTTVLGWEVQLNGLRLPGKDFNLFLVCFFLLLPPK